MFSYPPTLLIRAGDAATKIAGPQKFPRVKTGIGGMNTIPISGSTWLWFRGHKIFGCLFWGAIGQSFHLGMFLELLELFL
jgi:hypothetical protein